MFTTNKFKAAPLVVTEKNLSLSIGKMQAILINSGIANACTGEKGLKDARETVRYVSHGLKINKEHIAVTSTGKIGEFLPLKKIIPSGCRCQRQKDYPDHPILTRQYTGFLQVTGLFAQMI